MSQRIMLEARPFHYIANGSQRAILMEGRNIPAVGDLLELGLTDEHGQWPYFNALVTHVEPIEETLDEYAARRLRDEPQIPDHEKPAMVSINLGLGFD